MKKELEFGTEFQKRTVDAFGIPKRACFILVDEDGQPITKVHIIGHIVLYKNYIKEIEKRAFGKKKIVTYADLKDFLYARSIPNGRNMRKQELVSLGLSKNASHWEIVKKLQGRTVSDEYSIHFF